MIQSMTAFARESASVDRGVLTIELRSVNHRYLDCSFKLPDTLRALEPQLREQAGASLARGKLDCMIRLQSAPTQAQALELNLSTLEALLQATAKVQDRLDNPAAINALQIMQFPGVYNAPQAPEEQLHKDTLMLFNKALKNLQESRHREGEKLRQLVLDRLTLVENEVTATRKIMPALMQQQHERLKKRLADLEMTADPERLEQELVYIAHKADIDEELDRLEAHISEVRRALTNSGPCGRRLDFLMQELNREANTLSSKSQSSTTTQNAVELKVLIEQMREQIQNIE